MKEPKFKVGQRVYWERHALMRADVIEVIPRKVRENKYRLRWIDENNHETVTTEDKLTHVSFYWNDNGTLKAGVLEILQEG